MPSYRNRNHTHTLSESSVELLPDDHVEQNELLFDVKSGIPYEGRKKKPLPACLQGWQPFGPSSWEFNLLARKDLQSQPYGIYMDCTKQSLARRMHTSPAENAEWVMRMDTTEWSHNKLHDLVNMSGAGQKELEMAYATSKPQVPSAFTSQKYVRPLGGDAANFHDGQGVLLISRFAQACQTATDLSASSSYNANAKVNNANCNVAPADSPWASFNFNPSPRPALAIISPSTSKFSPSSDIKSASPTPNPKPLEQVFSSKVPMTPVKAREGSQYVSINNRVLKIHDLAYAQDNGHGPHISCKAIINKSYEPCVENNRVPPKLTYVGFVYPDETCLTYIPVKNASLLYRSPNPCGHKSWYGEEIEMVMERSVFERLKEMSIEAFLSENPGTKIEQSHVETRGNQVKINIMVKEKRTVKIYIPDEDETRYHPLLDAMACCQHDLVGDALLHIRFARARNGRGKATLRFILFGIQVTQNKENRMQKIFSIYPSW